MHTQTQDEGWELEFVQGVQRLVLSQRTLDTHAGWHRATHRQVNDKARETIHHNAARSLWVNYNSGWFDCPQTHQFSPNWPTYLFIFSIFPNQLTLFHQMKDDYKYYNIWAHASKNVLLFLQFCFFSFIVCDFKKAVQSRGSQMWLLFV